MNFQVKLSGEWKNYAGDEDKVLKRAFLAGFPNARYKLRGQPYQIDFKNMQQTNLQSGKSREIRPPYRWKPPAAPIVPSGPTVCVKVPEGAAGTQIKVPNPRHKGSLIAVDVPATAKTGHAMLVPVPEPAAPEAPEAPAAPAGAVAAGRGGAGGYRTGAKVAAGVGVAGVAVAGAVLGAHIAEDGWDATMEGLGDGLSHAAAAVGDAAEDAGEAIADAAEDAVDWVGDAAEAAGDFIMDLF